MTQPAMAPVTRPPKALVVEDDRVEAELLADFLRLAGFEVDMVGDGAAALDYLCARSQGGRPDVLLLDMDLPRCDGPKIVDMVRREPAYAALRILAVTGYEPEELGLDSRPAGIDAWFRKPLNADSLLHELQRELSDVS